MPSKTPGTTGDPSASALQRLIRSRSSRLGLAFALLALTAWAFWPYVAYRVAPSAFVNAELLRITSPLPGRLSDELPRKGQYFDRPTTVPLVRTIAPDRRTLLDLDRQYAIAKERAAHGKKQLAEIAAADDVLGKRLRTYQTGMVNRLTHEIEEAEAERTGCLAEVRQRRDVGSRMERLAKSGATSQIRSAEALANQEAASTKCEMADARLSRLRAELASAQNGVFLRDGTNDVPYSQQQRDRLFLRRQELETDVLQETSRAAQLAAQITEERGRLERVGHYDVTLPADYVVWSVAASPGSAVTEGQVVLDLANCQTRFLAVELPEREFEQIKPGDAASIRLIGSDDWEQGQVRQVRGSAARGDDRLFAAQLPNPTSGQIAVEIGLSADAAPPDRSNFCDIGRLAEVRFARPSPAIIATLTGALRWVANRLKTAEHTDGVSD